MSRRSSSLSFAATCALIAAFITIVSAQQQIYTPPTPRPDGGGYELEPVVVPFVRTANQTIQVMLAMTKTAATASSLEAHTNDDVLFDIGSGKGDVLIEAVRSGLFRRAVGIDHSSVLVKEGGALAKAAGFSEQQVENRHGNFFLNQSVQGIETASVVYAYLLPQVVDEVYDFLRSRLRPGTVLIFLNYPLEQVPCTESFHAGDAQETTLHKYVIGAQGTQEQPSAEEARGVVRFTFSLGVNSPIPPNIGDAGNYRFHQTKQILLKLGKLASEEEVLLDLIATFSFSTIAGADASSGGGADGAAFGLDSVWVLVDEKDVFDGQSASFVALNITSLTVNGMRYATDKKSAPEIDEHDLSAPFVQHNFDEKKLRLLPADIVELVVAAELREQGAALSKVLNEQRRNDGEQDGDL